MNEGRNRKEVLNDNNYGGTVVALPPPKKKSVVIVGKDTPSKISSSSSSSAIVNGGSSDPKTLLDTLDSFGSASSSIRDKGVGDKGGVGKSNKDSATGFDPIEFLNHHFVTEAALVNSLELLRDSIQERVEDVDENISTAIQKQAELADLTRQDVAVAKNAIHQLTKRIQLVQSKAVLSEQAVLIITRDMKRLDYAKKHLSKTITAIKRLHMLLHAVHQLHLACMAQPFPDFKNAANLIDATRLLLSHFDTYMPSISKLRDIRDNLTALNQHLDRTILLGFRIVGIGFSKAIQTHSNASERNNNNNNNNNNNMTPPPPMPPEVLADACLVIHALGDDHCQKFISSFCSDHLEAYIQLFDPNTANSNNNTYTNTKPSFKINPLSDPSSTSNTNNLDTSNNNTNNNQSSSNSNPASLDQVERRYSWFRRTLRELDDKFHSVFPITWNLHYAITRTFLLKTKSHLLLLFQPAEEAPNLRDPDCQNVTVILKALQKTILFEKEMTAWLQRDYKTIFTADSTTTTTDRNTNNNNNNNNNNDEQYDEQEEALEFDESGKAVVATSAEGIRIKYERKMKQRKKKEQQQNNNALTTDAFSRQQQQPIDELRPVPTLIGLASKAFDKHMGPYIAQEEQYMDEQLQEAVTDATVDTRGDLPVFTSSTNLFVYIKNSITRCTSLTRGETFFLLYQAFKRMMTKYAQLLTNKFPSPSSNAINIAGVGQVSVSLPGTNTTASSNLTSYRIPPGEETTICHVIDTCEYCADTVEALQDLIKDKIDDAYKSKIDMYDEQECFHDATAKGLTVLVSGLTQRMELALKEMTNVNWGTLNVVGEESKYVRTMHDAIQPFVVSVRSVLPSTYFRNFCDKFAASFTSTYYNAIIRQKRISESGTQQFLLDVYNLKTLLLKLPVMEPKLNNNNNNNTTTNITNPSPKSAGSTIAPAMYTKMVNKQFQRIEILLKLIGTPTELLIDVFKVQWENGTALNLQTVMNLKGMKRNEQAAMLERFGVDAVTAMKGASMATTGGVLTDKIEALQDKSSDVAAKVNSDLFQMRQKVEGFRKAFR